MKPARTKTRLSAADEERIRRRTQSLQDRADAGAWMQESPHDYWLLLDEIEALRLEMVTVLWMLDGDGE